MNIFGDERLLSLGVINGTTTRDFGNMREYKNQDAFFERLDLPPENFLKFKQTHSAEIIEINNAQDIEYYKKNLAEADGWLLNTSGVGAVILTADCVPLYIWDEKAEHVALIHAGWRGIVAGIPAKAARMLKKRGGKKLYAFAGPHIQECCFEIKDDIVGKFDKSSIEHRDGKIFVSLRNEIRLQLTAEGLQQENIHTPCSCTYHNKEKFFSYRRDHTKDCIMSFIYKI
ncbi:MAG: polyphenol oxidase family protein [Elusimicrobia bacterium]|nr:polyphenol oxidase family protein [Elusimicrobiota bacterium]